MIRSHVLLMVLAAGMFSLVSGIAPGLTRASPRTSLSGQGLIVPAKAAHSNGAWKFPWQIMNMMEGQVHSQDVVCSGRGAFRYPPNASPNEAISSIGTSAAVTRSPGTRGAWPASTLFTMDR
jgi:hypothetical protein